MIKMPRKSAIVRKKPEPVKPTKYEILTFLDPGYSLSNLGCAEPSAFNGHVQIHKWRVTAEIVDEPIEILIKRLRKLWRECDNHHEWEPLQRAGRKLGIELDTKELGTLAKTRLKLCAG